MAVAGAGEEPFPVTRPRVGALKTGEGLIVIVRPILQFTTVKSLDKVNSWQGTSAGQRAVCSNQGVSRGVSRGVVKGG